MDSWNMRVYRKCSQTVGCVRVPTLRIDNSRQSAIWTILVYSSAILCRLSYYISEERLYLSLSKNISYFIKSFTENK